MTEGVGMGDSHAFWDVILPELLGLFGVWTKPTLKLSPRQKAGTLFAMRSMRRLLAVDGLFRSGYYLESHVLVRAGYEDWVCLAYLLREPGDARCEVFTEAIHKQDARVYDAFAALCGSDVAERYFVGMPEAVRAFTGLPRSHTRPISLAAMADDVGLRKVHDFVYSYLSGLSHPDARLTHVFDQSDAVPVARIPARNLEDETRLALWLAWFTSRIAVRANCEFGVDHEPFVEEHLLPFLTRTGLNIETCVLVREGHDEAP
ncbi:MAG: DUF5677 domain-containing protein [Planctomycetota bacterium]